jgi:rhodanese-related sulfurtransferase
MRNSKVVIALLICVLGCDEIPSDTETRRDNSVQLVRQAVFANPETGVPMALYTSDVAEIGRLVGEDKSQPLVLYCNGPYCGKSKRVANELLKAGYINVRRYQLGAPVWRALVGIMVIEPEGARYVLKMEDHNTRIIVFGQDSEQASDVAEALVREAFHNVTYFAGNIQTLIALIDE